MMSSQEVVNNYVYVYSDPDTKRPFYIGVGQQTPQRAFSHLDRPSPKDDKGKYLLELEKQGKKPIIEILIYGVSREVAENVEAAAIDLIGINNLTNVQKGRGTNLHGKIHADLLDAMLKNQEDAVDADLDADALFLCVNGKYRRGMTMFELYDAARGFWKFNNQNRDAIEACKYIMPVYNKRILDVYVEAKWFASGTGMRIFEEEVEHGSGCLEFIAKRASIKVRKKFVGKVLNRKFPKTSFLVQKGKRK